MLGSRRDRFGEYPIIPMQNDNRLFAWMIFNGTNSKLQTLDEAETLTEVSKGMEETVDILQHLSDLSYYITTGFR